MFDYHKGEGEHPKAPEPRPVYAIIDHIEPGGSEDRHEDTQIIFDCIDAALINELSETQDDRPLWQNKDYSYNYKVSIIEAPMLFFSEFIKPDTLRGQWFFIDLGGIDHDAIVHQYHNLFSDPTERGFIGAQPVTPYFQEFLNKIAGWTGITGSSEIEIIDALSNVRDIEAAAIYDVGQGAATSLLDDNCMPVLYFDLGGSAIANWRSFPGHLENFCFTNNPPIVLTHWDWDHWSSALRDRRALSKTWILPIQREAGALGAVHSRFIAELLANDATCLWWDYNISLVPIGRDEGIIFRAGGTPNNRNESGLALKMGDDPIKILLPGDASITNLLSSDETIDHLMVPHHGGKSDITNIPVPHRVTRSHLIYSYGTANSYLHPLDPTVHAYRKNWKRHAHTALRDETGFGHVGIRFDGTTPVNNNPPCSWAGCQLTIRQWL
ncbi:MAG: hypothetical protein GY761_09705 [Hyphomicrobiales bacterium]|nr:hypothetical protein [Hyphomicrobiales bacterium]